MSEKVNLLHLKGAESRERLVDAAVECFARYGFDATSVRTIAEEAGVAFQLIRHHFGSKDDLWLAAAMRLWDKAQGLFERAFSPPAEFAADPREAFRHFVYVILEYQVTNPNFRRMFIHEFFADSDRYRKILRPYGRKLLQRQLDWLRAQAQSGVLERFTPEEALLIFRNLVVGITMLKDDYELLIGQPIGSKAALQFQTDLLVNLLFDGRGLGERTATAIKLRRARRA